MGVPDQRDRQVSPHNLTVLPYIPFFLSEVLAFPVPELLGELSRQGHVVGMSDQWVGHTVQFLLTVAEHRLHGKIRFEETTIRVGEYDPHDRTLEDCPESRLTVVLRLSCPSALRHVSECEVGSARIAPVSDH